VHIIYPLPASSTPLFFPPHRAEIGRRKFGRVDTANEVATNKIVLANNCRRSVFELWDAAVAPNRFQAALRFY